MPEYLKTSILCSTVFIMVDHVTSIIIKARSQSGRNAQKDGELMHDAFK